RGHHKALPFADVPAVMKRLRALSSTSAAALEFTILTAARSGETLGAQWSEFDLDAKVWTVPGQRMKAGKEHRVPLSEATVGILRPLHEARTSNFVFPGAKKGQGLSVMAMAMVLRGLRVGDTVHGFRSSFRDW